MQEMVLVLKRSCSQRAAASNVIQNVLQRSKVPWAERDCAT